MSEEQSQVIPFRAEIRCNNFNDEYVQEFVQLFLEKELKHEIIIETREDIDVRYYDLTDTLIDHIGLLHKG